MNDTMNVWRNVWNCPDDTRPSDKTHDATVVVFALIILFVITVLFYTGSYIQTEVLERHLIQCKIFIKIKKIFFLKFRFSNACSG